MVENMRTVWRPTVGPVISRYPPISFGSSPLPILNEGVSFSATNLVFVDYQNEVEFGEIGGRDNPIRESD